MAILCAVGEDIHEDSTAFARAVTALAEIPLRMVSQAASRRNITFVMRNADAPEAMRRLHDAFFGHAPGAAEPQRREAMRLG
jgi:aspartokinase